MKSLRKVFLIFTAACLLSVSAACLTPDGDGAGEKEPGYADPGNRACSGNSGGLDAEPLPAGSSAGMNDALHARTEDEEAGSFPGAGSLFMIRERGVLFVGTTGDYRPMSFLDPDTGEYWGYDTELAEDLAEALGVELAFIPTSWPDLMEDTRNGRFDLAICGITITDARKEQALMSEGYLGNGKTILCRAEDAGRYTSLEQINRPEVRVMENPGGLNEAFAREKLPNATLIIHDANEEIPGLIAEGKADVMITETMEAEYYAGMDSRLAAPVADAPFTQAELGILMPKGAEDLAGYVNAFLETERETGRLDELAETYIRQGNRETLDGAA